MKPLMLGTILCSTGDLSGDRILAPLIGALNDDGWATKGLAGDAAQRAGLVLIEHLNTVTAHGLVEAIGRLPPTLRVWTRLRTALQASDGLLLVDYPEVNMRLLKRARRIGLPVCYVAPPQAWAWRPRRAHTLRKADWVGCLFEFEAQWFRSRGVPAEWIGHPLGAAPVLAPGADGEIALLPGSRIETVRRLLPIMLDAARLLFERHPGVGFHLGMASTLSAEDLAPMVAAYDLPLKLHDGARGALAAASVAVAGAGTVSLEAALMGRRCLVLGKLNPISALVARRLVTTPHYALPNMVLGREVCPELIQETCDVGGVLHGMEALMNHQDTTPDWLAELRAKVHRPDGVIRMNERVKEVFRLRDSAQ